MSLANPRWGAPRIHGELLKLGIDIGETTVAKYMVRPRRSSSQTWKTLLKNHMHDLVSADFFVVPTATVRFALCLSRALARSAAESYILLSLPIPLLNGLHSSFGTPFPGTRYLDFYCTTATHATEKSSIRQHVPWAKAPRSPRWVSFDTVTRSNCANHFLSGALSWEKSPSAHHCSKSLSGFRDEFVEMCCGLGRGRWRCPSHRSAAVAAALIDETPPPKGTP
jgi:hypothetical protein